MVILVTYTNEEDPYKNEGTRVVATFLLLEVYGEFSRRFRAATCNSAVWGLVSNLSQALWLYLLPARTKKIQSIKKALEWSQHYSLISQMLQGC